MAISDELTRIQNAKTALKTSIEAKGVTVPSGATIDAYPSLVDSIQTGGGSDSTLIDLIERDLTSLDIPSGTTKIGNSAFSGCTSLTSIGGIGSGASLTIPNTVTSIDIDAFKNCTLLRTIDIPSSVTSIGSSAFTGCTSATTINIPNTVSIIGTYAFSRCQAAPYIDIPSSVTSIGGSAFSYCTSLRSINIPNSVTSIGYGAFSYLNNIHSIIIDATTPPTLSGNVFDSTNNCPIYVPSASVATYKAASYWSSYASRIKGYTYTSYDYGVVPTGDSLGIRFSYQDIAESLPGGVETATVGFTDGTNTFQVLLDAVNGTLLVDRMMNSTNYQKEYTLAEGETYTLMFDVPMYFDDTISEGLPWTMEVAEIDA